MKFKLVKLGWLDAIESSGWYTLEEALKWGETDNMLIHEVGWILKETKEYILFACRWSENGSDKDISYGSILKIPKPWIKYRTKLSPSNKGKHKD